MKNMLEVGPRGLDSDPPAVLPTATDVTDRFLIGCYNRPSLFRTPRASCDVRSRSGFQMDLKPRSLCGSPLIWGSAHQIHPGLKHCSPCWCSPSSMQDLAFSPSHCACMCPAPSAWFRVSSPLLVISPQPHSVSVPARQARPHVHIEAAPQ